MLKGYFGGLINDALDLATKPMESVMDGLLGVGSRVFSAQGAGGDEASQHISLDVDGCGTAQNEWHVVQGYNDRNEFYSCFRHRKYGTCVELWGSSGGSFNFVCTDGATVRHCFSITDYYIENR